MRAICRIFLVLLPGLILCACEDSSGPEERDTELAISFNLDESPVGSEHFMVVHRSDGSVVESSTLEEGGNVAVEIERGDWITLLRNVANEWELVSFADLRPGQHLELGYPFFVNAKTVQVLTVDADIPVGAAGVQGFSGCDWDISVSFPKNFEIWDFCMPNDGKLSAALYAENMDGEFTHFNYAVDLTPDPSRVTAVDLTGGWRTDWQPVTISFEDADAWERGIASVVAVRGGSLLGFFGDIEWTEATNVVNFSVDLPTGLPDQLSLIVGDSDFEFVRRAIHTVSFDGSATSLSFHGRPPRYTNLEVVSAKQGGPQLEWAFEGERSGGDFQRLEIAWTADVGIDSWEWTLELPPDWTSIQLPELPEELAGACPPDELLPFDVWLQWVNSTLLDGYSDYLSRHTELRRISPPSDNWTTLSCEAFWSPIEKARGSSDERLWDPLHCDEARGH